MPTPSVPEACGIMYTALRYQFRLQKIVLLRWIPRRFFKITSNCRHCPPLRPFTEQASPRNVLCQFQPLSSTPLSFLPLLTSRVFDFKIVTTSCVEHLRVPLERFCHTLSSVSLLALPRLVISVLGSSLLFVIVGVVVCAFEWVTSTCKGPKIPSFWL